MNCPRCQIALSKQHLPEQRFSLEIDSCSTCNGIWFDKGELQKVEQVVEPVIIEFRNIPNEYDQLTALHCPSCEHHPRMQKHEHPRDNKVIMDVCDSCQGIWLDGGELEAIQKENWWETIGNLIRKL